MPESLKDKHVLKKSSFIDGSSTRVFSEQSSNINSGPEDRIARDLLDDGPMN